MPDGARRLVDPPAGAIAPPAVPLEAVEQPTATPAPAPAPAEPDELGELGKSAAE